MTICIAALAEKGKMLILCSDNMITASIPMGYEFETEDMHKIHPLTDNAYILSAGNALIANQIITNAEEEIKKSQISKQELSINQIAEIIRITYQNCRRNIVIQRYLEPRGLDINTYYSNQRSLEPNIVAFIDRQLEDFNIGVDLIIAGHVGTTDKNKIFGILHPGIISNHDAIGYLCIGSGYPYAFYHFIEEEYRKDMPAKDIETMVRKAKERSQKAPGVGAKTTCKIVKIKSEVLENEK